MFGGERLFSKIGHNYLATTAVLHATAGAIR